MSVDLNDKINIKISDKQWRIIGIIYSLILVTLSFIRLFDNNFWQDECFSIRLFKMSIPELIHATAVDVHPPLYYLIGKIFCDILGFNGWTFHFISFVPYVGVVASSLTHVWKKMGKETALIMITFASLLDISIRYNVEVRMYSWGIFFVLLSYLQLKETMETDSVKSYVLFSVFSLAAAFVHYYALITVAFFYIIMLLYALINKKPVKRIIITWAAAVICYCPWLIILLTTMARVSDNFWIQTIENPVEILRDIFCSKLSFVYLLLYFIYIAIVWIKEIHKLSLEYDKRKDGKKTAYIFRNLSSDFWWIFAGMCCLFGTIFIGIMLSIIIRPLFLNRYILPASSTAWLILAFCIGKTNHKKVVTPILIIAIVVSGIPSYCNFFYKYDKELDNSLSETLYATENVISSEGTIITTLPNISWTISEYYYPGVTAKTIYFDDLSILETSGKYWYIVGDAFDNEQIDAISQYGYSIRTICENSNLGTYYVYIYELIPINQ